MLVCKTTMLSDTTRIKIWLKPAGVYGYVTDLRFITRRHPDRYYQRIDELFDGLWVEGEIEEIKTE